MSCRDGAQHDYERHVLSKHPRLENTQNDDGAIVESNEEHMDSERPRCEIGEILKLIHNAKITLRVGE